MEELNPTTFKGTLRELLQKAVNVSPVMDGKTQLKTEDVLDKQLTIAAFDIVPGKDPKTGEEFSSPVFNFLEYPLTLSMPPSDSSEAILTALLTLSQPMGFKSF